MLEKGSKVTLVQSDKRAAKFVSWKLLARMSRGFKLVAFFPLDQMLLARGLPT